MITVHQKTILVVDDEEVLRNTILFDLKRKGFKVLAAENGVKAFELVKSNQVDLVISDIRMPGGDGLQLLDEIRGYDQKIPVLIFITGFADISEDECKKRGAKCVLPKPFNRKALMKSILESLGISEAAPTSKA